MPRNVTPTYVLLNQITLATASSSVTFSNIPQNYADLIVVCNWANSGTASAIRIQLNGDTGGNYSGVWITGTGSNAVAGSEASETSSRAAGASVGPANTFSNLMTVQFLDYSSLNKQKPYLVRYGSAATESQATASRWANTAPITSVRLFDILGQTFQSGAKFFMYGVVA